jgi:hypothetical protein
VALPDPVRSFPCRSRWAAHWDPRGRARHAIGTESPRGAGAIAQIVLRPPATAALLSGRLLLLQWRLNGSTRAL